MVPLTLLAISITNPLFFNFGETINELVKIPQILSGIGFYVFFIVVIELTLRVLTFIGSFFKKPEEVEKKKNQ